MKFKMLLQVRRVFSFLRLFAISLAIGALLFFAQALIVQGCVRNRALPVHWGAAWAAAGGKAADLGPVMQIGWPQGVPMTCHALTDALAGNMQQAVERLRFFCNTENQKRRVKGQVTCPLNHCLDSLVTRANGYNYGKFILRLDRNIYTGEPYALLNYTYPLSKDSSEQANTSEAQAQCFDPDVRASEVLEEELGRWDFQRFVKFCAAPTLEGDFAE
jgi:hypothetical protein